MKKIKSLLIRILGREMYLRLTSRLFFLMFRLGWLRSNPAYRTHYFVRNLIRSGQTVVDIGANLGYFSAEFARLTGPSGKVYSVEPIELYRRILTTNLKSYAQVTIFPFALGETEGTISMGLPFADQHRHGLMKVLTEDEKTIAPSIFEVEMKNPAKLFDSLSQLHYLKCDIEGYEVPVIPAMLPVIEKHLPVVQIETSGNNQKILYQLFSGLGYQLFYVGNNGLVPLSRQDMDLPGDLIGIPPALQSEITPLVAQS